MFEEALGDVGLVAITHVEPITQSIRMVLSVPTFSLLSTLPLFNKGMSLVSMEINPSKRVFTPPYRAEDFAYQMTDDQVNRIDHLLKTKLNEYLAMVNELRQIVDEPIKVMPLLPLGVALDVEVGSDALSLLEFVQCLNEQQTPLSKMMAIALTNLMKRVCHSYKWTYDSLALLEG